MKNNMKTPIYDFVKSYAESDSVRLHMPGHKGRGPLGFEKLDITEFLGADDLFAPDGIIAESENNATALFGTAHTFYSTEGSTLAIKAMLALAVLGKKDFKNSPAGFLRKTVYILQATSRERRYSNGT